MKDDTKIYKGQLVKDMYRAKVVKVINVKSEGKFTYPIKTVDSSGSEDGYRLSDLSPILWESHDGRHIVTGYSSVLQYGMYMLKSGDHHKEYPAVEYNMDQALNSFIEHLKGIDEEIEIGRDMVSKVDILKDVPAKLLDIGDSEVSLDDRYARVMGSVSEITVSINENIALIDSADLTQAFIDARSEIEKVINHKPSKLFGILSDAASKIGASKMIASTKESAVKNASVQTNINQLFGKVSKKYDKLLEVGTGLQNARSHTISQINALSVLLQESEEYLSTFAEAEQPLMAISTNSHIHGSIKILEDRLLKVDGAILGAQSTITLLGKELPALKSNLTDDTALTALLDNMIDYQNMFTEVSTLVTKASDTVSRKSYEAIEGLLDIQIKDTSTRDYLTKASENNKNLSKMLAKKSGELKAKVIDDAAAIASLANDGVIEHARKSIKELS